VIAGDMTRRVIVGRLDAGVERPQEREFQTDPVKIVMADRGKYATAASIAVRAYLAAGQPDRLKSSCFLRRMVGLGVLFSRLARLSRSRHVMQEARVNDPALTTLRAVLELEGGFRRRTANRPQSGGQTSLVGSGDKGREKLTELRAALAPVASVRNIIDPAKLAYWLRKSKGRPVGGLKSIGMLGRGGIIGWQATHG
jgi:putative DNA primase/helicase